MKDEKDITSRAEVHSRLKITTASRGATVGAGRDDLPEDRDGEYLIQAKDKNYSRAGTLDRDRDGRPKIRGSR